MISFEFILNSEACGVKELILQNPCSSAWEYWIFQQDNYFYESNESTWSSTEVNHLDVANKK